MAIEVKKKNASEIQINNARFFFLSFHNSVTISNKNPDDTICQDALATRYCPRFFNQVGHQTMYASIGNKHFVNKNVIVRSTKIMNRADKMAHF